MDTDNNTAKIKQKYAYLQKIFVSLVIACLIVIPFICLADDNAFYIGLGSSIITQETVTDTSDIVIEIPRNSTTNSIANILYNNGIIRSKFKFKLISKIYRYDVMYKAGTHKLSPSLSYKQIMTALCSDPYRIKVTIPEGFTLKQITKVLYDNKLINNQSKFLGKLDIKKANYMFFNSIERLNNRLEGYLFPDTYFFDLKISEDNIIDTMLDNFDHKFSNTFYHRSRELGITVDGIITLASIIERESKLSNERKVISSVFWNRLKSDNLSLRRLQSCATVEYVLLMRNGTIKEKLLDQDLNIDSPYNTYKYEGLPPGPICCPGISSIEAALYPMKTTYYYFLSKGDGAHVFSTTLKEHNIAKKKYGLD